MNRPAASIIVPAYNAARTIDQCVNACRNQTVSPIEVIVVDDGSTDNTASLAGGAGAEIVQQENAGPAAARNTGARAAKSKFLVFTDSDCVPQPDWIASLLDGFEPGVVGVGGTYAIANPESSLARMIQHEIVMRHARLHGDVDFLGSFNVAYDREAFWNVGGFDESYPHASAEDNDLAYRLHERGGLLRFTPNAVVAHHHPERLTSYLRTQANHGYWRMKLYANHRSRALGDRYASRLDLWAPGVAVFALAMLVFSVLLAPAGLAALPVWVTTAWVLVLWMAIHIPKILRMIRASEDRSVVLFLAVAMLRDLARAAGMLRGIARFWLMSRPAS